MRSISKGDAPSCLSRYEDSQNWDEIVTSCKNDVAETCFQEQNGLCVYCGRSLELPDWQTDSHCEHLVPRKTKTRVYDHRNIALSCNGTPPIGSPEYEAYGRNRDRSCGRSRDNRRWQPELFLHPVDEQNIERHFLWDLATGRIRPSEDRNLRASHMIEILNLNNSYLLGARQKARGAFFKLAANRLRRDGMMVELTEHRFAFSGFLKAVIGTWDS